MALNSISLDLHEPICLQGRHFTEGEKVLLFTPKEFIPIVHNGLEWLLEESKSNHPDLESKCVVKK